MLSASWWDGNYGVFPCFAYVSGLLAMHPQMEDALGRHNSILTSLGFIVLTRHPNMAREWLFTFISIKLRLHVCVCA